MIFTPLPYDSYEASAEALTLGDVRRARLAALDLVYLASTPSTPSGEPFRELWRSYFTELITYGTVMEQEWQHRGGFGPSVIPQLRSYLTVYDKKRPASRPPWLGHYALHSTHRSYLLASNLKAYAARSWNETPHQNLWFPHVPS